MRSIVTVLIMDSPKVNPRSPWQVIRWVASTDTSRFIAAWLNLGLFVYLTSWSVWTILCLVDLTQLVLRGDKRGLRLLLLTCQGAALGAALVLPERPAERSRILADNIASTRQRLSTPSP